MAIKKLDSIPNLSSHRTAEGIAARRAVLECDLRRIVMDKIEYCEITDVELSETYGKYMLEGMIRKWCKHHFGRTALNYFMLADAFTVIKTKKDEKCHFYIRYDPEIWRKEFLSHYAEDQITNEFLRAIFGSERQDEA